MPSRPPAVDIDLARFSEDPYPIFERLRRDAPIAFVPQLGSILFTRRDDISECEKNVAVFSSDQPAGLMNRLMGRNMMRKDGDAHLAERKAIFPSVSPRVVLNHWTAQFRHHATTLLDGLVPRGRADLHDAFALPYSAECLKSITGLENMRFQDMDAWSQAMIAGISNYAGDPATEARCHAATAGIDAAITDMWPVVRAHPNPSLLSVMTEAGLPEESMRANIKLAISGGQNEPRHVILGTTWALLTHDAARAAVDGGRLTYGAVFDEYVRWLSPIGMSPRRVARGHVFKTMIFEPDDRVFFMFGAANRDEAHFEHAEVFDPFRDNSKSIPFGAGPHFCAGAAASRAMIADVALPLLFERLPDLRLEPSPLVRINGWAFRGLQNLPVCWNATSARSADRATSEFRA